MAAWSGASPVKAKAESASEALLLYCDGASRRNGAGAAGDCAAAAVLKNGATEEIVVQRAVRGNTRAARREKAERCLHPRSGVTLGWPSAAAPGAYCRACINIIGLLPSVIDRQCFLSENKTLRTCIRLSSRSLACPREVLKSTFLGLWCWIRTGL